MILDSIKTLLVRSKKRRSLSTEIEPLPNAIKHLDPSISPVQHTSSFSQTLAGAIASGIPDTNIGSPLAENHPPTILTSSFLPHAHDFFIDRPNMIANITNLINSGTTVLQLLSQKRISGAEVDSSARDPPPKCHHETRKSLRGRIISWVTNPDRHWRMLWIIGPMGVGKSAVAQTIAEEFSDSGRLGASLFFSRPNQRDDPDGVIPTLAYQLADKYPEYKRIVTERLAGSTSILEKARRIQFKELIIEPFRMLVAENAQMVQEPLLIILDGLDECKSKSAQCEFVELISDHVRQVESFPLLWMICSRPEWHLKGMLSDPDFQITCGREEIIIDDAEAQQDVTRFLEVSFRDIYRKYYDRLDPGWPPKADVRRISATASGHFAFASTIIKFVGDERQANPRQQLFTCIRFLGGSGPVPGAMNPLHALDLLYRQILSAIPKDTLSATLRILGLSIVYSNDLPVAHYQAKFLCLDQEAFYRSLQDLHSVLDVPTGADAHRRRIGFYHASFSDYLSDQFRSGSFRINKPAVHLDVAIQSLIWQRLDNSAQGAGPTSPPDPYGNTVLSHFSSRVGWKACCNISDEDVPHVIAALEHFDFNSRHVAKQPPYFGEFLAWLYKLGNKNKSLICIAPADSPDWGARVLSFTHGVRDIKEYLSVFSVPFDKPLTPTQTIALRLQLGQGGNSCNIDMIVKETTRYRVERVLSPGIGRVKMVKMLKGLNTRETVTL